MIVRSQPSDLEDAAAALRAAPAWAALTGAGISAECGIPPFRGPGGLWDRFPPEEYATIEAFRRDPAKVWTMLREIVRTGIDAEPGRGHRVLAEWEEQGRLLGLVTQNVDGLHQRAGSREVVELHGSGRTMLCCACGAESAALELELDSLPPGCDACGGVLRPDVVLFGELLPDGAWQSACEIVERAGVLLVVGTSCEVAPASYFPRLAQAAGATVIEINPQTTALTLQADLSLRGEAGRVLSTLRGLLVG